MSRSKGQGTLCWECANAVPDQNGRGCSWSKRSKPVRGWVADRADVAGTKGMSYFVHGRPQHISDGENHEGDVD